jgi:hypothetical protein
MSSTGLPAGALGIEGVLNKGFEYDESIMSEGRVAGYGEM